MSNAKTVLFSFGQPYLSGYQQINQQKKQCHGQEKASIVSNVTSNRVSDNFSHLACMVPITKVILLACLAELLKGRILDIVFE